MYSRSLIFIIIILFSTKVFSNNYDISCYNFKATENGQTYDVNVKTRLSIDLNTNQLTRAEVSLNGEVSRDIIEHNVWVNENKIMYSDKEGQIEYDMNLKI